MPHFILEYTDNIKEQANIPQLLEKINTLLMSKSPIIPVGGIRSRAIELQDYRVADGSEDDAFVHATLKLGAGRSDDVKKEICEDLFNTMKDHFSVLYKTRFLALSLELYEFTETGTYKLNNIHDRFKN
ncbi:5-carboxymethyl-2-hydroxymuconate Delta-isomerase [Peribacillus sp. SCS-155]|uniref:5-carboxymethyl-2-hydroxymuconate Delta-isomerase n=1 Tax=Peribacillus sedimenti TaxID=3115297 RepID=UPI003906142F